MRTYIRHPSDIPIEIIGKRSMTRRLTRAAGRRRLRNVSLGGLCCESRERLSHGARVGIRIPGLEPAFEGEGLVVWCHPQNDNYEVGICFLNAEDAFRARMVEQICHIEQYRKDMRDWEGRELSAEQAAAEWISKYAAHFPSLGQS